MNKQPVSQGLIPPEGESTCEGYDLRKHGQYPTSQTVESTSDVCPKCGCVDCDINPAPKTDAELITEARRFTSPVPAGRFVD